VSVSHRRSVDSELPYSRMTARHAAREHGLSERSNDVRVITPTVSTWDQHFAVLSSPAEGEFELQLACDPAAVEQFYVDRIKSWLLVTSYGENDVYSRWYKLTDTRGEMTMVATGKVERNHVVVLFPAWTDGIIGEITWTEPPWAARYLDTEHKMEISRRLDAYDAAWQAGDLDARLSAIEDKTCSVVRIAGVNGPRRLLAVARSKDELRDAWASAGAGRILEFERLTRLTTSTYVFASYRMVLEAGGRKVERETAAILPIGPSRRFVGELSYSMEVEL
jgi:hypothetical protein